MRFVHTSDWHLGRRLGEASLLEDQAHALEQVLEVCRDERADALVVAGDVFDRAVPPVEAVALFDEVLARAAGLGLQVVVCAGNHDSPERLGYGRELFAKSGITLVTSLAQRTRPVVVGDTSLYVLPFLEPVAARAALGEQAAEATTHDAAVRAALREMLAARGAGPAVLVAHLFAAGGRECADSERPLAVGGAGMVGADALEGWSYVALGHLHAPQLVGGREAMRYSGSLYKYSFGEAEQQKGVCVVEIERGVARVRQAPLRPRRDVVSIEGNFDELRTAERFAFAEAAWVEATYTDSGYVVDAAARLRERFPGLLAARPRAVVLQAAGAVLPVERPRDDLELLRGFWSYVGEGAELETAHVAAYERAIGAVRAGESERPVLEVVR